MSSADELLEALGHLIRTRRTAASLTQDALGARAGIVGKYVSEIERGTRDLPLSTLHAVVENGLGLRLDVQFQSKGSPRAPVRPPLPRSIEELGRLIAELPADQRSVVLAITRHAIKLAQ